MIDIERLAEWLDGRELPGKGEPIECQFVSGGAQNEIYEIHVASRRTYGAPRVEGQLRHRGQCHSRKRVARIMAECGLVGAHSRRKWRRGRTNTAPAPDLLERDFAPACRV